MEQTEQIQPVIVDSETVENDEPKETAPYTKAKAILLQYYNDSEETRLRKLFQNTGIEDKKPTEVLAVIRKHGGSAVSEIVIKELWWNKIPDEIKPYLTSCSSLPLDKYAEQADTVHALLKKATTSAPSVCAMQEQVQLPSASISNVPDRDTLIINALASLQKEIAALSLRTSRSQDSTRPDESDHSRTRSTSDRSPSPYYRQRRGYRRHRTPSRGRVQLFHGECWYHHTFGDQATKCKPNCKHYKNNSTSQSGN